MTAIEADGPGSSVLARFPAAADHETPFLVLDVDVVAERYRALARALPFADIFYAVKANPEPAVLRRLLAMGCRFDVASVGEIDLCLAVGASPDRLSFGNTVKKVDAIVHAYALGVRLFAFDAESELAKLSAHAPGATVFCRVLCDGSGADWPLSRKFGCEPELAGRARAARRRWGSSRAR
jgi:ornithine decarboxylase